MTEREITELLATRVMGWQRAPDPLHSGCMGWHDPIDGSWRSGWTPLHNIADAWMIVEKLQHLEPVVYCLNASTVVHPGWGCNIGDAMVQGCKTAQEAICNAAIKLVEVNAG